MIEVVSGENKNLKKISGVTFGALQFKGYKIREKIEDDGSVTKNKVFSVEFFVDKPTFKEIKKSYKKITTEEIDSSDIERRFHIPVPIEGEDEQYKGTHNGRQDARKPSVAGGFAQAQYLLEGGPIAVVGVRHFP
jgi:hypothetical protein